MQRIIDISHYQTVNDWCHVKRATDMVALKATQGHALSSDSYLFTDSAFHEYAKACIREGIPFGAYHFLTASTMKDAVKEADYFCSVLDNYRDKLAFAVCDAENYRNKYLLGLSRSELTAVIKAFCARVESQGHLAMHYTNVDHVSRFIDVRALPYKCWCASYGSRKPSIGVPLAVWQYSDKGRIQGINENVDTNHGYFDDAEFAIFKLQAAGIINTPLYWIRHYGELSFLDLLLKRCAARIKAPGKATCANVDDAISRLHTAGIIDTPLYWKQNAWKLEHLQELIVKLGSAM